jgi:hypothetical protein
MTRFTTVYDRRHHGEGKNLTAVRNNSFGIVLEIQG